MQIVCCQFDIAWENKAANFRKVRHLLAGVNVRPGALIVLPEMFATGYSLDVDVVAESGADRPTEQFLAELARQQQAWIVGGLVTRDAAGKGRNEALVVAPDGREAARYCKLHPFSLAGEHENFAPGQGVVLFSSGGFTAAPFVCYDLRFPEIFRAAVGHGADLAIVIANWPATREAHWLTLLAARAIENQAYVVGVNRCGRDPQQIYSGRSLVFDPHGTILADAGNAEGVIDIEIDPRTVAEARRQFPALRDRRAEFQPRP